ncbi:MAG TPA: hypothetical protein VKZ83_00355, partial [Phototrophicaceae bacterium]|nr:hypothetical protein [Phototrophicaceae bacterium]
TRAPVDAAVMARVKDELLARGVLPLLVENRIHVVPPCVITEEEVAEAVAALDAALALVPGPATSTKERT